MLRLRFYPELSDEIKELTKEVFAQHRKEILGPLLPVRDDASIEEVLGVASHIRENFKKVYLFGMGGSILPAKAALGEISERVVFVENYMSREFEESVSGFDENTHFIFVSKSGRTLEVCLECAAVTSELSKKLEHPERNVTIVTADPSSPLVKIAPSGARVVKLPDDVSGRFSLFTAGALLPAAVEGEEYLEEIITAGNALIDECEEGELAGHVDSFLSHVVRWYEGGAAIMVIWLYERHLRPMGRWLQQIWCESLGKKEANFQPDVLPVYGPDDQHTVFQQFVEGEDRRFYVFLTQEPLEGKQTTLAEGMLSELGIERPLSFAEVERAQKRGIRDALIESGRKIVDVAIPQKGALGRAYFMGFTMITVACAGFMQDINPYNQPGVELGKRLTMKSLE